MNRTERVIVIFYVDEKTKQKLASHGIGEHSMNHITLPNETAKDLGAVFDPNIGEFVIP